MPPPECIGGDAKEQGESGQQHDIQPAHEGREPDCAEQKHQNGRKWVSPSPKYVGAGTDDRVIWGRRDGNRLLGEAMKEQSPSL